MKNQWNYGSIGFFLDTSAYIFQIFGISGGSVGSIALDDIIFQDSKYCSIFPPYAIAGPGLPLPSSFITTTKKPAINQTSDFDCDFEVNFCNWKNDKTKKLEWLRNQGETGSDETGPTVDST